MSVATMQKPKRPILVMARSFPPSIEAGGCTVLRHLFNQICPGDYVVVRGDLPPQDPGTELRAPTLVVEILPRRYIYSRFAFLFAPVVILRAFLFAFRWRPRHVFTVYPFDFFVIAALAVARLLRLPFSIYLLDVWADAGRNVVENWVAERVEPIAVRQADHVFVISDALKEHYGEKYGVDCTLVRHPIPFELFEPRVRYEPSPKTVYHIVYTGNVSGLNIPVVKNLVGAVRRIPDLPVQIDFYSGQNSDDIRNALGLKEGDRVTVQTVPSEDIPRVQQNADILFAGLSFDLDPHTANSVFPTKFVEYLCAGKPILVNAPGESFLSKFVNRYHCALALETQDIAALQEGIRRLICDSYAALEYAANAVATAQLFEANRQASIVADALSLTLAPKKVQ